MLTYKNNTATIDGLFSMYYVLNEVLFNYLKAYHQILPEQDSEQALMLITLYINLHHLPG